MKKASGSSSSGNSASLPLCKLSFSAYLCIVKLVEEFTKDVAVRASILYEISFSEAPNQGKMREFYTFVKGKPNGDLLLRSLGCRLKLSGKPIPPAISASSPRKVLDNTNMCKLDITLKVDHTHNKGTRVKALHNSACAICAPFCLMGDSKGRLPYIPFNIILKMHTVRNGNFTKFEERLSKYFLSNPTGYQQSDVFAFANRETMETDDQYDHPSTSRAETQETRPFTDKKLSKNGSQTISSDNSKINDSSWTTIKSKRKSRSERKAAAIDRRIDLELCRDRMTVLKKQLANFNTRTRLTKVDEDDFKRAKAELRGEYKKLDRLSAPKKKASKK